MRPTAKELLKHQVFDDVRIPENEIQADHKIILPVDIVNPIKYDEDDEKKYTKKKI